MRAGAVWWNTRGNRSGPQDNRDMAPDSAILTAQELAAIRRDYRSATLLPKRAYQDPGIHDWVAIS